jgi:hypothetical protein
LQYKKQDWRFEFMEAKVTLETVCVPSEDIVAREIEGDMIIVPLVAGIGSADDELYTLNDTAKAIWRELDGDKTLAQAAEVLAQDFSSPAGEIAKDVLGFAAEMVSRGILSVKKSQ